jgi:ribose 5-phosphate isomerase B
MNIYIASDHAGFELKAMLAEYLVGEGHTVQDLGPHTLDPADDYPDFCTPLAHEVAQHEGAVGIVIGRSGQGEAIACNRVPHVRAVVFYGGSLDAVRLDREHNDANVLSLSAASLSPGEAQDAVHIFLATPFSNEERHVRRIAKLG